MTRHDDLMALRGAVRDGTLIPESLIVAKEISHAADRCFGPHDEWSHFISSYEGSLDATKALHDAVLPRVNQYTIDEGPSGCGCSIVIWPNGLSGDLELEFEGYDDHPARAWLLAILEALIAQEAEL